MPAKKGDTDAHSLGSLKYHSRAYIVVMHQVVNPLGHFSKWLFD
jgi:hypothetical protein